MRIDFTPDPRLFCSSHSSTRALSGGSITSTKAPVFRSCCCTATRHGAFCIARSSPAVIGDVVLPPQIADHALIGDTRAGALCSIQGSIGCMCLPRFDSEPIFDTSSAMIAPAALPSLLQRLRSQPVVTGMARQYWNDMVDQLRREVQLTEGWLPTSRGLCSLGQPCQNGSGARAVRPAGGDNERIDRDITMESR